MDYGTPFNRYILIEDSANSKVGNIKKLSFENYLQQLLLSQGQEEFLSARAGARWVWRPLQEVVQEGEGEGGQAGVRALHFVRTPIGEFS